MFEVNNKDTRTTPMAPCSSVFVANFEQVNAGWVFTVFDCLSAHLQSFKKSYKLTIILVFD